MNKSANLPQAVIFNSKIPKPAPLPVQKPRNRSWFRSVITWTIRLVAGSVILIVLYILSGVLLGSIPVNTSFRHTPDGIEIAVLNNGVHCDLALPLETQHFNWKDFLDWPHNLSDTGQFKYALFGWGNRRFYIETRTWEDIKLSNSLAALTGLGETVMHVDVLDQLPKSSPRCRRIRISEKQYGTLCESLQQSFARNDDHRPNRIPGVSYRTSDAFYEGTGSYHLFNTCNVWSGRNLQKAGVQTGWWTPFSFSLFGSLPAELWEPEKR